MIKTNTKMTALVKGVFPSLFAVKEDSQYTHKCPTGMAFGQFYFSCLRQGSIWVHEHACTIYKVKRAMILLEKCFLLLAFSL